MLDHNNQEAQFPQIPSLDWDVLFYSGRKGSDCNIEATDFEIAAKRRLHNNGVSETLRQACISKEGVAKKVWIAKHTF